MADVSAVGWLALLSTVRLDRLVLSGVDGDLLRLHRLGLRQDNPEDTVIESGLRPISIHRERQRDTALIGPTGQLLDVPGGLLALLRLHDGPDSARLGHGDSWQRFAGQGECLAV